MAQPLIAIATLAIRATRHAVFRTTRTTRTTLNQAALVETSLLAALGILLLTDVARGVLAFYINPRYNGLVLVGALALLALAAVRVPSVVVGPGKPLSPRAVSYVLLSLPLLFGVLYPPQPLGADRLAGRGLGLTGAQGGAPWSSLPASTDTRTWTLLDWAIALDGGNAKLEGSPVQVVGFVYHPQTDGTANRFEVARYVVTCCVADSTCIGLPVIWQGIRNLPSDSWVVITGTIGHITSGGAPAPAIIATRVTPVPQPANPYLAP